MGGGESCWGPSCARLCPQLCHVFSRCQLQKPCYGNLRYCSTPKNWDMSIARSRPTTRNQTKHWIRKTCAGDDEWKSWIYSATSIITPGSKRYLQPPVAERLRLRAHLSEEDKVWDFVPAYSSAWALKLGRPCWPEVRKASSTLARERRFSVG